MTHAAKIHKTHQAHKTHNSSCIARWTFFCQRASATILNRTRGRTKTQTARMFACLYVCITKPPPVLPGKLSKALDKQGTDLHTPSSHLSSKLLCVYVYVCMFVCVYLYVCMYVCRYVHVHKSGATSRHASLTQLTQHTAQHTAHPS